MSSTMPPTDHQCLVISRNLPLIGEAKPATDGRVINVAECQWILRLAAGAIDAVLSRDQAADRMGLKPSQLSRNLVGDGHLSMLRYGALDARVHLQFADAIREHYGRLDRAELIEQGEALIDRGRQLLAKAAAR